MVSHDYVYRVEIAVDPSLNSEGYEKFSDAIVDAELEDILREAVRTALDARVPKTAWDTSRKEERAIEWYSVRVVELWPAKGGP
jgi:hypothetical protein